jgi:enediyne polyketide synthase
MTPAIAIVGMACRYPDAHSPQQLWETVLAQRTAFRKLPPERLQLSDYYSPEHSTADAIYSQSAALIRDYDFDRHRFRTVGSTFRSADFSHWMALEVAADALADAGFADGIDLPHASTGVILGNTLTGELSRANTLRLRWPYVKRTVSGLLRQEGKTAAELDAFLNRLEECFKAPFEPIGSESLAGSLSNTIAGRICNHFDLHGGGFTVDGACSSSLLAVAQACTHLLAGDLEVAIAGGVDISIDPFELVGFAKVGALTPDHMRVYDQRSSGFIPGEGCGMVVLMPHEAAIAQHKRIYAVIRGWGISSDGQGGMTRPEVVGQQQAIERTYHRAHWPIHSVGYFEGHGTGTVVGDATELQALSESRLHTAPTTLEPVAIGSIKANIGHTKAAAGVAGLIKATLALHSQVLPPTSACPTPHTLLNGEHAALKVLSQPEVWPAHLPLRAGVSAMGFGGINTHLALENPSQLRRSSLSRNERLLAASHQDAELLLFSAESRHALITRLSELLPWIDRLSRAELGDLSATLAGQIITSHPLRAAVVADSVPAAVACLERLLTHLQHSDQPLQERTVMVNSHLAPPRLGFLFPGQAAPVYRDAGLWGRRFGDLGSFHGSLELPDILDHRSTALAQPAIIASTLVGLRLLRELRIEASAAIGHSLGELAALHWAGAINEPSLLHLARERGRLMQTHGTASGAMASIEADAPTVQALCGPPSAHQQVGVAGVNSPRQTVIAGDRSSVEQVVERARAQGLQATLLPVSQAFHSPLVAPVAEPLRACLASLAFAPLRRTVLSTVTGQSLAADADLQALLLDQITQPVHFLPAITLATPEVDLWLEVGPGHILSRLASQAGSVRSVALDSGGTSLAGLLEAIGAVFTLGGDVHLAPLFQSRFHRPLALLQPLRFISNPCEQTPHLGSDLTALLEHQPSSRPDPRPEHAPSDSQAQAHPAPLPASPSDAQASPLEHIRQLVALRTELPIAAIGDHHRFLSDLHLNSITVGQLVSEATRTLGLQAPADPTAYANASLAEVAAALSELQAQPIQDAAPEPFPAGVAPWLRAFRTHWQPEPLPSPPASPAQPPGAWQILNLTPTALSDEQLARLQACPGRGWLVLLPEPCQEATLAALLEGTQQALQEPALEAFVVVHAGWGSSWAKSLHLEHPQRTTLALEIPLNHPQLADCIRLELQAAKGFVEARTDSHGQRWVPILQPVAIPGGTEICESPNGLSASDALLVSGGGKGIAAECALALAKESGCQLVLLGRSNPSRDADLARNLERIHSQGVDAHYFICDVGKAEEVQQTLATISTTLRPITALLHAAGINHPRLLSHLTPADLAETFHPKVAGLTHLLATIPAHQLKRVITFGSIIARSGMAGDTHYAVANELLNPILAAFQAENPHCVCLNLEWSVWGGIGMGERLGRIEALSQQGILPITPDQGVDLLKRLLRQPPPSSSLVISSRMGDLPTIRLAPLELPLQRFLEIPRVVVPGVELVVDVTLSLATDPYLRDHVYQGENIFPGVMGLEAMAQVASALVTGRAGEGQTINLAEVQFHRPIVVPASDAITIRIAAIAHTAEKVEVVIRTAQTGFAVDHFRATVGFGADQTPGATPDLTPYVCPSLEIDTHLYGELLFHQRRFQRISQYHHLRAKSCVAAIATDPSTPWFSDYLPQTMLLGDAGARDAAIHALQACVPHATILPVAIKCLRIFQVQDEVPHTVKAIELSHGDGQFIYDLWVLSADGALLEHWQGLTLQVIQTKPPQESWSAPLLPPYLERCLLDEQPQLAMAIALAKDAGPDPQERTNQLLQQLAATSEPITRRIDGKPDAIHDQPVSASHCQDLTLAVLQHCHPTPNGTKPQLACDIEQVSSSAFRPWEDLLGDAAFQLAGVVTEVTGEAIDIAATRIWSAKECLKKAGLPEHTSLTLHHNQNSLVWLEAHSVSSGAKDTTMEIATWAFQLHALADPVVVAILTTAPD